MSHGSAGNEIKAEPNLTPLLDLVLQLLMFFIITANFASQQTNEHIQLPEMQSARPLDKNETEVLFLNLTKDGVVEAPGKDPMKKPADIKTHLRSAYNDAERIVGKGKEVNTLVVIRADKSAPYKDVYQLMRWCKEAGFRRFQIRATLKRGGNG